MARVLIVEDDLVIVEMLAFILLNVGHAVLLAGDGQAGIDRVVADHPDLIVMDSMLPTISGGDCSPYPAILDGCSGSRRRRGCQLFLHQLAEAVRY